MSNFEDFVQSKYQIWENLTLANDFMFGKVFQDEKLCLELVRLILPELDIERVVIREHQREAHQTMDTRGVRFDVYLHDDKGRIINIEMQVVNRGSIPRRTRAYHSMIDLDAMDMSRTGLYENMPEVIVIFICAFDPFNLGRHVYTFKNVCIEERDLIMNDGATTIFMNTKGTDSDISPRMKAFLEFLEGRDGEDEFVGRLKERLAYAKQDKYWRQEYLLAEFDRNERIAEGRQQGLQEGRQEGKLQGLEEGRQEGKLQGLEEGRQEGKLLGLKEGILQGVQEGKMQEKIEIARRMRNLSMNDEQICLATGLSSAEISRI